MEYDPTAFDPEPDEETLPAKPAISKMPPEEGVEPPADEDEETVLDEDFLDPDVADRDLTVDDKEQPIKPKEGS